LPDPQNLFAAVRAVLSLAEADEKLAATRQLLRGWRAGALEMGEFGIPLHAPARPARPELVAPAKVPKRKGGSAEGRVHLIHAIAHIEFNAIHLALDAVQRFAGLPRDFYDDWLTVAAEEVYHFELVRAHLRHHGHDYGDFPAHNSLWENAEKSAHDPLLRMALVPRVLEARGLDVNPGLQQKLLDGGDANGAALLTIILRDEVGHVAAGDRWFRYLCRQRGLDAEATFRELVYGHFPKGLFGPFNLEARRLAGFSDAELAAMTAR